MSDRLFWVLGFLAAVGLIVVVGLVDTAARRYLDRHIRRAEQMPLPPQISHCRTIPLDRQETTTT